MNQFLHQGNGCKCILQLLHEDQTTSFTESESDSSVHVNLQVPYHLHAVLVHEGQANAGHYWAFIYDQPRKSWLKYNDISVTESSWEELERDSFGGLRNASAYCLMYISDKVSHVVAGRGTKAVLTLVHYVLSNYIITKSLSVCVLWHYPLSADADILRPAGGGLQL